LRAAVIPMLGALPAIRLCPCLFTYTPAEAVRKLYPGDFFAEMPEFARRIESVTAPEAPVFIFGAEPELLFYAHRPSATRYIFLFPLYGPYGNAREKQMAAAAEIERARPSTAIDMPNAMFFVSGNDKFFPAFPQFSCERRDFESSCTPQRRFGASRNIKRTIGIGISRARSTTSFIANPGITIGLSASSLLIASRTTRSTGTTRNSGPISGRPSGRLATC